MHKIAFHLNNLEQGGAERVVSTLANQFAAKGYEVIVATEEKKENEFPLDPRVRRVIVGLKKEDENKGRLTKILLRRKYLRAFMLEEKPDVLIAFARKALYRALSAERGTGVPVVFCVRIDPVGHYDSFVNRCVLTRLLPRAAGAVFQTSQQRDFFRKYWKDNACVILNPVNPRFLNVPKPERREKIVVSHARLAAFKNQALLIDAFLKVHAKHPDWELEIWGPDSLDGTKQNLEKKIRDNHAEDFIHLCGGTNEQEKVIPRAGVYAYSSDYEGMPNSLIEAMVMGMPVVSTDCPCGGPAELIQDGVNGLLVPVKDADALAGGINRLIEDRDFAEKLGSEARKLESRCRVDLIYQQWRDYLEKVCVSYADRNRKE
ncbi:MAG TPA: glycosyltransferase family 4 protein [Lachnospiraceae bacterium]|jgi:glycosyltransferase involved in cell wall biosynthesis|nr:glycosyltransferase family 4 protein [Lachnospiraceae bacterium]